MVTPYWLKRVPPAVMLAGRLLHESCAFETEEEDKKNQVLRGLQLT